MLVSGSIIGPVKSVLSLSSTAQRRLADGYELGFSACLHVASGTDRACWRIGVEGPAELVKDWQKTMRNLCLKEGMIFESEAAGEPQYADIHSDHIHQLDLGLLDLEPRLRQLLQQAHITNLRMLCARTQFDLLDMPGITDRDVKEIQDTLQLLGESLRRSRLSALDLTACVR